MLKKLNDESIIVLNEAADGIFDICGQDETQELCKALNILSVLVKFQPEFIGRVRYLFKFEFT